MPRLGIALSATLALSVLLGTSASAHIPVGAFTHAVAINHTTGLAYVGAECTCGGSVVVIDTATDLVVATLTTASTPRQIAIDEERNRIFAAITGGVSVIDGETNTVLPTLTPGGVGLAVDPARDRLYATLGTGGMAVYDLNALDLSPEIVSHGVNWQGVAVNPVTDRIYLTILQGAVSVLDGETFTALVAPIAIGLGEGRFGIAVDSAANRVYVARFASAGRILVIDGATNTIAGLANAGSSPVALALDAARGRLYSADSNSGTVSVLSTEGPLTFLSTISVGGRPNGVAVPSRGAARLYVSNSLFTDLTVQSIAANTPPVMISATIAPTSPDTDDVLAATVAAQDPDGDLVTYAYQWTKGGANIPGATGATLDLAISGNGDRGDEIAVRVTASDGRSPSEPLTSTSVTVVNSAPSMASVTIAPTSPQTNDLLTATVSAQDPDGDPLDYSYQWTRNGDDIAGAIGATLDLSVIGHGDRGDDIAVRVTASDDVATSDALESAAVTVINSAPSMISASIAPTSPHTNDVLTATVSAQDPDGDSFDYSYQWTKAGANIPGATAATLDLALSGNGDRGDVIAVRVTASDDTASSDPLTSASVTVINSAPSMVSVTIAPTSADTDDVLTATAVAQDQDGDPLTYSYQWTKNGDDIPGAGGATLDLAISGNGDRGDAIAVRVTANDLSANSEALTSSSVTVINTAPAMISAAIAPTSPDTDDVLTATAVAQDPDGDPLTYSYQWTRNGADIVGATGATLDLAVSANGDRGEEIAVRVTASDGSAHSDAVTSASVTVANSAPSASVTLTPTKPSHKGLLSADVAVADADRDSVVLTYVWRVQGEVRRTMTTTATTDQFDLSLPHNGTPHDTITVTVTPDDGLARGADATATAIVLPGN